MKSFLTWIPFIIASVVYTDASSECPNPQRGLPCGSVFMSMFLSGCQSDIQCPAGSKCCTVFWCVKRCTPITTPAPLRSGQYCTSPSDCPISYCCVNRQPGATSGGCQKMGGLSEKCYIRDPFTAVAPPGVIQTCPCGFGNFCAANPGETDQFGQIGHCNSF